MLAFVFQTLAERKPDVDGGVYGYACAGFGNYIGYTSAFGYWASAGWATSPTWCCCSPRWDTSSAVRGWYHPAWPSSARRSPSADRALPDFARRADRRVRQRDRHDRQDRADPDLHRHRDRRIQGRPVHRRLLGPTHPDRRKPAGQQHESGQEHDARDRLGFSTGIGRAPVVYSPAGLQPPRRRAAPLSRLPRRTGPCCSW